MVATTITKNKKRFSKRDLKKLLFYIGLIALPLIQFAIFTIAVNFNSLIMAFQTWKYNEALDIYVSSFAGFDNFSRAGAEIFQTSNFGIRFGNSALAYAANLFITTPLALVFSYYISKKLKGAKTFRVILFIPTIICSVVLTSIFRTLCQAIIPSLAHRMFFSNMSYSDFQNSEYFLQYAFLDPSKAFGTMVFYSVFIGFGANVLLYTGAMSAIDKSNIEAAKLDGCSDWQEFIHVILPGVFPTLTTFIVVGLGQIFINQLALYDMFGPSTDVRNQTIGYYLYTMAVSGVDGQPASVRYENFPYLSAMGIIFTLIITPICLGVKRLLEKFGPSAK